MCFIGHYFVWKRYDQISKWFCREDLGVVSLCFLPASFPTALKYWRRETFKFCLFCINLRGENINLCCLLSFSESHMGKIEKEQSLPGMSKESVW